MKPIDYLYFNIYNHFYQRSYTDRDFNARIQTMYLFALSAGGWILFLEAAYLRIMMHAWFISKPVATIFAATVYLFTALVFHHIFIVHERDRKIYVKYEGSWDSNPNKKRDLLISVFVVLAPYVFLFTLAFLFPRHS